MDTPESMEKEVEFEYDDDDDDEIRSIDKGYDIEQWGKTIEYW